MLLRVSGRSRRMHLRRLDSTLLALFGIGRMRRLACRLLRRRGRGLVSPL